jgi:hypothetical protein
MLALLPRGTIYIVLLVIGVFLVVQYIPIYFNALQFNDHAYGIVRFAGSSEKTVAQVRMETLQLAEEWAVPVQEEDINVEVTVTRDGPVFYVESYYAVPVNLSVYQHEVEFDWEMSGETIGE